MSNKNESRVDSLKKLFESKNTDNSQKKKTSSPFTSFKRNPTASVFVKTSDEKKTSEDSSEHKTMKYKSRFTKLTRNESFDSDGQNNAKLEDNVSLADECFTKVKSIDNSNIFADTLVNAVADVKKQTIPLEPSTESDISISENKIFVQSLNNNSNPLTQTPTQYESIKGAFSNTRFVKNLQEMLKFLLTAKCYCVLIFEGIYFFVVDSKFIISFFHKIS
jgi:hypothetical protein